MSLIPFNNWGGPFPIQPPPPHPRIHPSSLSLVTRTVTVGEEEEEEVGGRGGGGRNGAENKIQRRTGDKAQNVILPTFSMRAFHHYSKISF